MKNPVIIFGAGIRGRMALENFNSNEVLIYGFLDEDTMLHNTEISEVMVLGDLMDDGFLKIVGNKTEVFVALENKAKKEKVVKMLLERRKVMPVNAIHNKAVVSEDAELGHGILISAGAIVGQGVKLGSHSVIHSSAIIEVLGQIGEFAEIGSGAIINAAAIIGDGAFVGSGAVVVAGVEIGKNARIGAGSVVIENVEAGITVFGNPAKPI
jgi:sugar O-acyltransferase (sialic acid O-acetyltransferase NeuD family)